MDITTDYGNIYSDLTSTNSLLGGAIVGLIITIVISIGISALMIISLWKIYKKNGMPGWYSIVPILNIWKLLELTNQHGWAIFIPFYNMVVYVIALYRLPIQMGKDKGFGILNIFFSPVILAILAFSKDKTENTSAVNSTFNGPINASENRDNNSINENSINDESVEQINNTGVQNNNSNVRYCPNCGTALDSSQTFCSVCGTKVE